MSGEPIKVFNTEFRSLEPFNGVQRAIEGVILLPVCDGKPVLSLCERINKTDDGEELLKEWALVSGVTKIKGPNDTEFARFSDKQFINGNNQITPDECAEITYENPRLTMTHHLLTELTDLKKNPMSDQQVQELSKSFDWLIQKINVSTDWEFIQIVRKSFLDKKAGLVIDDFQTSVGICRIELTRKEIDDLNIQILKFQNREQQRFALLDWELQDGKLTVNTKVPIPSFRYGIPIDEYVDRVRNYFANILFPQFGPIFAKLIAM